MRGSAGMDAERVERAAGMLPDAAPLIPVKAQSPKQTGQTGLASGRKVQPNPFADNLGNFVLARQPCAQVTLCWSQPPLIASVPISRLRSQSGYES